MRHVWHGPFYHSSEGPTYAVNRILEREGKVGDGRKWSGVDLYVHVAGKGARTVAGKIAKLLKEVK